MVRLSRSSVRRLNMGEFTQVSINSGEGEFEAKLTVHKELGYIVIHPEDPYRGLITLTNELIVAYDDHADVATVTLDLNRPPNSTMLIRFASLAAKQQFVSLIRAISSDDSGNSSSSPE